MNLTVFLKRTQSATEKAMAIACVAVLRVGKAAREAWRNRVALAPVVGRYFMVFTLGMLVAVIACRGKDSKTARAAEASVPETAVVAVETAPAELSAEEQAELAAARQREIEQAAIRREAQYMARVLYGTARNNTAEAQRAVCWCIINRVESSLFPNSIEEVCSQPVQWMGYSNDNPVTQDLFDVAMSVLDDWHSGGIRMFSQDYLYLSWSEHEIILRTSFNETKNTRYWHVTG